MENAKNGSASKSQEKDVSFNQEKVGNQLTEDDFKMEESWKEIQLRIEEMEQEENRRFRKRLRRNASSAMRQLRQIIQNVRHVGQGNIVADKDARA